MIGEDNFMITTAGSLLSKQHQIRMEMRRYRSSSPAHIIVMRYAS